MRLQKDGIVGYGEAAPNVRYGENAELTTKRINESKDIQAWYAGILPGCKQGLASFHLRSKGIKDILFKK